MTFSLGLIMFICIVPSLILCYVQVYPKNWKDRKLILGVRNREEFRSGETLETVEKIYGKYRKWASYVVIGGCVISCLLLFLKTMTLQMAIWTTFILLALIGINIPYFLGNREMKDLKRRLGLNGQAGVSYVDLSNAGTVHALHIVQVLIPNLIVALFVVIALLADLKVIPMGNGWIQGTFLGTTMMTSFWVTGLLVTVIAFILDRLRNDVISKDSAINANYNRAKKKNFADFFVLSLWCNTVFVTFGGFGFFFWYSEILTILVLAAYMLLIFGGVFFFILRERKIEERYQKETEVISDDDDNWILGSFYYNPKDGRLNVEKRVGVGGTINLAHPVGKLMGVIMALTLVFTALCLVWIGMVEGTPIKVMVKDQRVVCHQLRDEYVIHLDEIKSVDYGDTIEGMHFVRVFGVGMDSLLKGEYNVDGKQGCKVFLNPSVGNYCLIQTDKETYYVSGSTKEETKALYDGILQEIK